MRAITVARKPLSETNVARNVLEHGTGALNIDASRLDIPQEERVVMDQRSGAGSPNLMEGWGNMGIYEEGRRFKTHGSGRWPANLILQHLPGCQKTGVKQIKVVGCTAKTLHVNRGAFLSGSRTSLRHYAEKGKETVDNWNCLPECPVADLGRVSGERASTGRPSQNPDRSGGGMFKFGGSDRSSNQHYDTGTATRFFKQVQSKP
jgi:hypothetical protein